MTLPKTAALAGPVALLLMLLSACSPASQDAQAGARQASPTTVGVLVLQPQTLPLRTELAGHTTAPMKAEIRPQVSGLVQKRLFTEGALVKAGQLLYQIDPAPYEAALASAQATLARSRATLRAAQLKADRQRELLQIQATAQQDAEDAQAAVQQYEADVATAQAAVRTAQINLGYTRITAPITGRIDTSSVSPGALVTANQTTVLTTVQQFDPIYVDVSQSSLALLRLRADLQAGRLKAAAPGQARVAVQLEDGSRYPQDGLLEFSGVTVNSTTGTVTLRAVVPNPAGQLLPGQYVRAVLDQGVRPNALLVPQRAVSRSPSGEATALVVNAAEQVEQRVVKVGEAVDQQWLVLSGLVAGERVITEGLLKVKAGDTVRVASGNAGSPGAAANAVSTGTVATTATAR